ncbi:hypothetical protein [Streptomyces catenulae]|uniref:Secreted protein n=1 Tax=Streptomyces catenulae TaxID=66875 RepID=A0ABV2Z5D8_9ACTN|nr:hypothetical protein [Streptomyces catenulae]
MKWRFRAALAVGAVTASVLPVASGAGAAELTTGTVYTTGTWTAAYKCAIRSKKDSHLVLYLTGKGKAGSRAQAEAKAKKDYRKRLAHKGHGFHTVPGSCTMSGMGPV